MKVELGETYTDIVSKFEGMAISRTEYFFRCPTVGLVPAMLKDGKPIEPQWFEESRLVLRVQEKKIGISI